ncbi:E3 ubiquitin-protein ligase Mdm2 [Archocentrus centrarchus]|uniref:E3 ubiquitin-protein ligase Mdm2 n=1 Tax=Archocentrus centrarchus TaxID=63155 RepID=UPI0011E9D1B8|nr:E3 ubiquitin-protein ligase Mdm2 [Archocentrus centrarchus]XP_030576238.1 E3 ubiquitin-protein ligase Mdm2 [Archocentrus centrarchus]XP_030576239.1 E3 ubiquitin-protein ligase Mdm2 [Archocentrus centrarchus]XP_030576240.1 E3 ubiquitin-protein ligase Mdm2 [Archocentrus centrarchus]
MSADSETSTWTADDDNKLVRPKVEFCSLLQHAGATKDVFTMKEVMFYLGQYIIQKQLYDQKQQHIVHCAQDALGRVLGVDSFSVKEPQVLFAMITKNLVAVRSQESTSLSEPHRLGPMDRGTEGAETEGRSSSPDRRRRRRRRRWSCRSNEPGPSHSTENGNDEEEEEEDEDDRKRRRSDSYSLTFDDSLSWCVIGGLGSGRDRCSSQSSDSHSTSERSEVTLAASDSDSDNFSVEFEVESIDSGDYNEDDASLSADDEVYEVTIFEADDDDSFDEDTEITEADYWRCAKCDELNPPLPRNCLRCWALRQDWLPEVSVNCASSSPKALPTKPANQSAAKEAPGSDVEENGLDVPDGKRLKTPPTLHLQCAPDSASSAPNSQDLLSSQPSSSCSQEKLWTPDSQPSSSSYSSSVDSQELLPSSPAAAAAPAAAPPPTTLVPDLERSVSAEWRLPDSCLDPCLICQSRPKNGCIVHGRTGHLMSCYVCARKLKRRNKLCPVCRLPIQSVVLTYLS